VGYLLCGVGGALLFVQRWPLVVQEETIGAASQGPWLWVALVTFFLFPMVFVTIGAALYYRKASTAEPPATAAEGESSAAVSADEDQA
jgi:hypothetical protein